MKHIKRINELFDSEEIKSKFEVPYLKGEMPLKYYTKSAKLEQEDPLLGYIIQHAPFLVKLYYTRSGNLLTIGFHKHFKSEKSESSVLFSLEIRENKDKTCIANVYSTVYTDGKIGYKNDINKGVMSHKDLVRFIRGEFLDSLIEICKLTKQEFDWSILSSFDKNALLQNKFLN